MSLLGQPGCLSSNRSSEAEAASIHRFLLVEAEAASFWGSLLAMHIHLRCATLSSTVCVRLRSVAGRLLC